ncbi:flavodoxin family protein [Arundinibacter roseus]|uniref:Flavodoxin family protein n=1 Tax=Arundinibacter roseus TaxID=2070510 RepID=A0A4R4KIX6_9BACT|nr:NAD(P)H-dependent oxidoreductase [Arundinibacter roseus]TDB68220.1 flavodoxin family protein [Arundinibacter roseus]
MTEKPTSNFSNLRALYLNCSLKKSPTKSHTEGLMEVSRALMEREGVKTQLIRVVDMDLPPGIQPDMTQEPGGIQTDSWPDLFDTVMKADILIIGTPIWLGEKSSVASRLLERMYAMSAMTNKKGQYIYYGKVGGCVVTGNEDGIKHCSMGILYALQHLGYSIPPQADCGWVGEVGPGPSYLDEEAKAAGNDFTNRNTTFMTYNLMHLALLLKSAKGYSAYGNSATAWESGERWKFQISS